MKARDATRKALVTITPDATLAEAAAVMDREVVGALVVVEGEQAVGIVTDRDLAVRAVARSVPPDARVDSVMTTRLVTLPADADIRQAINLFNSHPFRRLPLVEEGRVVGMLTADDLIIDMVNGLGSVIRPIFGQVIFGIPEPEAPVPLGR